MKQVICIGECMVELLQEQDQEQFKLGFAGDTFNTAVYLKRQLGNSAEVYYQTALGDDLLSRKMMKRFEAEGICIDLVRTMPGEKPGLYLIENDSSGERFFQYWRSDSAARSVFKGISADKLQEILGKADLVYLSGISLAILDNEQRQLLFETLERIKNRTMIAFDPNFRKVLWPDMETVRKVMGSIAAVSSIVFSGVDDEKAIWPEDDIKDSFARWLSYGCKEVVIKAGSGGCYINLENKPELIPVRQKRTPLDTTGAGDSFCAGYLSAKLNGKSSVQAADAANRIAAEVVMHRGGIVPLELWNP